MFIGHPFNNTPPSYLRPVCPFTTTQNVNRHENCSSNIAENYGRDKNNIKYLK